jgi:hypothetical protein
MKTKSREGSRAKLLGARGLVFVAACTLAALPSGGLAYTEEDLDAEPPVHDEPQVHEGSEGHGDVPPAEEGGAAGSVKSGMQKAGEATESGVTRAGEATGKALDKALKATGEGVGYVIDKTGKGFKKAGEALSGE